MHNIIIYYLSSSPCVHTGYSLNRIGLISCWSWWNKSGVSLIKECGLEGLISLLSWMILISQKSVISRWFYRRRLFNFDWVILMFVKLVGKNAPWLPFIFTSLESSTLKSLSLVHSEVVKHWMGFRMSSVLVSIMITLNHNVMKVL